MFALYNIIYIFFVFCYLPIFLLRGKYHRGVLMRLGIFPQPLLNKLKNKKSIWLHTVSVGETQAAEGLVKHLRKEFANFHLVISTVTKTGNRIARRLAGPDDLVIYLPLDIGFIVKRVINLLNPQLFIVAETEIWPNLIAGLAKKKVAIALINGRLSRRSFKGYSIIRPFLKQTLRRISLFCMQTEEDAQRMVKLGAEKDKVKITGNMKFDIQKPDRRREKTALGLNQNEQLFIAGSTHPGEERLVLGVYQKLIAGHPDLRLLIAPRHIERTEEIEKLISKMGFNSERISRLNLNLRPASYLLRPILIVDTIGQLKGLYALADIVFIGGSLVAHGGQNPIEPAVFGKPILFGPGMSNFASIVESFLDQQAAIMVRDERDLENRCLELLDNSGLSREMGERAKGLVRQNQGASLRNLELIKKLIGDKKGK